MAQASPSPEALMEMAIEKCREGLDKGQSPFGCAIALGSEVIACSHNTVAATVDITAHAEVNALREACQTLGHFHLDGAVVATTCEPCPMCMAALHWARVDTVYYGASIDDAESAGFNELQLPAAQLLEQGGSEVKLVGGTLSQPCRELFLDWLGRPERTVY